MHVVWGQYHTKVVGKMSLPLGLPFTQNPTAMSWKNPQPKELPWDPSDLWWQYQVKHPWKITACSRSAGKETESEQVTKPACWSNHFQGFKQNSCKWLKNWSTILQLPLQEKSLMAKIKPHVLLLAYQQWNLMERVRNVRHHESRSPHILCCLRFWLYCWRQQGLQSWDWLCWNAVSSRKTALFLDETLSAKQYKLRSFQTWNNLHHSFWP